MLAPIHFFSSRFCRTVTITCRPEIWLFMIEDRVWSSFHILVLLTYRLREAQEEISRLRIRCGLVDDYERKIQNLRDELYLSSSIKPRPVLDTRYVNTRLWQKNGFVFLTSFLFFYLDIFYYLVYFIRTTLDFFHFLNFIITNLYILFIIFLSVILTTLNSFKCLSYSIIK